MLRESSVGKKHKRNSKSLTLCRLQEKAGHAKSPILRLFRTCVGLALAFCTESPNHYLGPWTLRESQCRILGSGLKVEGLRQLFRLWKFEFRIWSWDLCSSLKFFM